MRIFSDDEDSEDGKPDNNEHVKPDINADGNDEDKEKGWMTMTTT